MVLVKINKKYDSMMMVLFLILLISAVISYKIEPSISGLAAGGNPGPPGGSPPGQSGSFTTTSGTSAAPKFIEIYPIFPEDKGVIKNGEYNFSIKITSGGRDTSSAFVKINSTLFGKIDLPYKKGSNDIYETNITLKNKKEGIYKITVTVNDQGINKISDIFVTLNPRLNINLKLNETYKKGELINFVGFVRDFSNESIKDVNITISTSYNGRIFDKMVISDENGFNTSYLVSYADPSGIWNISLYAKDKYNNYGATSFTPKIESYGVAYYSVDFMSPLIDSSFRRGDIMPITVKVSEKNELVSNATVVLLSTQQEIIKLKDLQNGLYTTNYIIKNNDPLGQLRLRIQATKNIEGGAIKSGGDSISINVLPLAMNINLLSPLTNIIYTNFRLDLISKLNYNNGDPVIGADVEAELSNGNKIKLFERNDGVYYGDYYVSDNDIGTLDANIIAKDANENSGALNSIFYVKKRSYIGSIIFYIYDNIIIKFWWAFLAILISTIIFYKDIWEIRYLNYNFYRIKKEQNKIKGMQMDTEKRYYKEGSITKDEFKKLMEQYEQRSSKANEIEREISGQLNAKKKDL